MEISTRLIRLPPPAYAYPRIVYVSLDISERSGGITIDSSWAGLVIALSSSPRRFVNRCRATNRTEAVPIHVEFAAPPGQYIVGVRNEHQART